MVDSVNTVAKNRDNESVLQGQWPHTISVWCWTAVLVAGEGILWNLTVYKNCPTNIFFQSQLPSFASQAKLLEITMLSPSHVAFACFEMKVLTSSWEGGVVRHIEESTNECINKRNNKPMFPSLLSPSLRSVNKNFSNTGREFIIVESQWWVHVGSWFYSVYFNRF